MEKKRLSKPWEDYEVDNELFETTLEEILEHEKKVKERYEKAWEWYKEHAKVYLDRADEYSDELDDTFNPNNYTVLEHVGYAYTILDVDTGREHVYKIDYDNPNETIPSDFAKLVFSGQDFLSKDNPRMLIHQWQDMEDEFQGYLLFPIPNEEGRYWMVYYLC